MKKIKLHQLILVLFYGTLLFSACTKKTFTLSNSQTDDKYERILTADSVYSPPAVIAIPDNKAKISKDDELYYDDEHGYRYWRYNDGKYYLDKKYNTAPLTKRKTAVVKLKIP